MNRDSFTKWLQKSKEKLQSLRREKSAKNVSGKQKKELSPRAKTVLTVLGSILAVCLCTVLIVGLAMGIYTAVYTYGEPQIDLEEYKANQNQTTIIYAYEKGDRNKPVEIGRLHGEENRIWVDAKDMPQDLLDAAVALEDKRFYKHGGVDWFRMASSLFVHGMSQGGSTITQQLIKNLTDNNEVTINRKFNEMLYALNLERHSEKIDILEAYLNTIYLGEGCYGVQTAAEKYFGKDVGELNAAECATLVSITQFPTRYDPLINPDKNKVRQEFCLKTMNKEKMLTDEEYQAALNTELIFTNSKKYVAKETTKKETAKKENDIYSYYVEYVIDEVCKDLQAEYGWTYSQAMEKINYGGLQIYTAVDLNVQEAMEDVFENRKTFPKEKDTKERPAVQAAMTVMTYDGRVAGIVGGAGQKTQNRGLNRAANSPRQPGSSIKPLSIYAPAIEKNKITWSTMIPNAPIYIKGKQWPMNYGQKIGGGELLTVQNALARSLNTIPARILEDYITIDESFYFLKDKFHFTTLAEFGGKTDRNYAPLATGAMNKGMTTVEMAAAYASFGNGGYYYEPYCYYKVTDSKGEKVFLEHKEQEGERIMAADTADVMCELLQSVTTYEAGTTKNYRVNGFQTMAKTGTTTDEKDRWFAAGTPYYISATWYGYDTPREINNVSGNPAGKIFKAVFDKCHKGLAAKQFPKSGIAVEKTFCTKTGLIASPNCTSTQTGWYRINGVPGECTQCAAQAPVTDVGGQISEAVSDVVGAIGDVISNITGDDE